RALRRDKPRLDLFASPWLIFDVGMRLCDVVRVSVVNSGRRPVQVTYVNFQGRKRWGKWWLLRRCRSDVRSIGAGIRGPDSLDLPLLLGIGESLHTYFHRDAVWQAHADHGLEAVAI